ncbi:hypothetical protein [Kitasatospora aureofaciens]|uniref:hypothetical protein n=1 Tax=Kitasatospora aureofaciens TaxID=1894 RepID=UPI0036F4ABA7
MGEWLVVRVPDPEGSGRLPKDGVLGIRGLRAAVAGIGWKPGDPVFVSARAEVDGDLLDSFGRGSSAAWSGRRNGTTVRTSGFCRRSCFGTWPQSQAFFSLSVAQ